MAVPSIFSVPISFPLPLYCPPSPPQVTCPPLFFPFSSSQYLCPTSPPQSTTTWSLFTLLVAKVTSDYILTCEDSDLGSTNKREHILSYGVFTLSCSLVVSCFHANEHKKYCHESTSYIFLCKCEILIRISLLIYIIY